jgi:hypothetical protein
MRVLALGRETSYTTCSFKAKIHSTCRGTNMSDTSTITAERKKERDSSYGTDKRKLKALEDIADALEGIRQELAKLVPNLP